ncbi:MAG: hypothetical protein KDC64_07060 [Aequorivita sp.]|nr:hypothetical protein [Aequorivita sp.]
MKKSLLYLFLIGLVLGCSKDADNPDQPEQDFTVILDVDQDHSFGRHTVSASAFLSNQNGDILVSGELHSGQTTILTANVDPSLFYDLTYVIHDNNEDLNESTYRLVTFSAVQQGSYTLGPTEELENSYDEIFLNFANTGYPCEIVASNSGRGTFGPQNGGYLNWQSNLVDSPTSNFYMALKSPNDLFGRYIWLEDVAEGSSFNLDYMALPQIQDTLRIDIPDNENIGFQLCGMVGSSQNQHPLAYGNLVNGASSLFVAVPQDIFNQYVLELQYRNGNDTNFFTSKTSAIPSVVQPSELNILVNDPSPQNFKMQLEGDGILYNVIFGNANASGTLFVFHSIYGQAASEVTFSKENLRLNIQQQYPDLSQMETVLAERASISSYSELNGYNDILNYLISREDYGGSNMNGSIEVLTKEF